MAGAARTTAKHNAIRRWDRRLAFPCQDQTKEGETSRFFKLVRR